MNPDQIQQALKDGRFTLTDVIDAVIQVNGIIGVGKITLAEQTAEYIRSHKGYQRPGQDMPERAANGTSGMTLDEMAAEQAVEDDRIQELMDEHLAETDRQQANMYNLGWAQGDDWIQSKTSKGRLYTGIGKDGSFYHEWTGAKTSPDRT